jgi:succinate dehydrogenase / fumarate reductase cytochrome b subunit
MEKLIHLGFQANMILSGSVILAFGTAFLWLLGARIHNNEVIHGFYKISWTSGEIWKSSTYRIYCVSFVLCPTLACMVSILQCSQLFNNKYSKALHKLGYAYAIVIPVVHLHCIISSFQSFNYNGITCNSNGPISDKWTNYKKSH